MLFVTLSQKKIVPALLFVLLVLNSCVKQYDPYEEYRNAAYNNKPDVSDVPGGYGPPIIPVESVHVQPFIVGLKAEETFKPTVTIEPPNATLFGSILYYKRSRCCSYCSES